MCEIEICENKVHVTCLPVYGIYRYHIVSRSCNITYTLIYIKLHLFAFMIYFSYNNIYHRLYVNCVEQLIFKIY